MAEAMHPDDVQLLIAGYVLCDLSPEEAAAFEQQMLLNPALAAEVAQMQQALETAYGPPEEVPPAHLRQAVLAAAAESTLAAPVPAQAQPDPSVLASRRWGWGWAAIALALIAGLSLSNLLLWRQVRTLQLAARPEKTLELALQPTTDASPAVAVIAIDPNRLEATFQVENLPPLPAGKVYVLWTVIDPSAPFTADPKNAILTEVFNVDAEGRFSGQIPVPSAFRHESAVQAVAVTIEDADAPQRHVESPILIEKL